jgi:hypothetical protein
MIELAFVRDELLPEILLQQLPDAPPAATSAVNVRRSDISAADVFAREARTVGWLRGQAVRGGGELYVAVRDWYGRHRVSQPVRYQDYPIGRVLVVVTDEYLSVAPASRKLLLTRLHEARAVIAE